MKRTALISAASALLLAAASCSHFEQSEPVIDHSFEIGATVAFSPDYLRNILTVSLNSGEDGDYVFNYLIDNDPSICLTTVSEHTSDIVSGKDSKFAVGNAVQFLIPKLDDGEHVIDIELVRNGVSRTKKISFKSSNSLGFVVNANGNLSRTKVVVTEITPLKGAYTVSFLIDDKEEKAVLYHGREMGSSLKIDFSLEDTYEFELPNMTPGHHTVTLVVTTGKGKEMTTAVFTEPQRKPVTLSLRYNDISGEIQIMSENNPLDTEFTISLEATVKGYVTWRHKQAIGIADPSTDSFNERGESSVKVKPGLEWQAVDSGTLKRLMDLVYSNTRVDAANAIGNGNARTVHAQLSQIDLKFTIHSLGVQTGNTAVVVYPRDETMPVKYKYDEQTYYYPARAEKTYGATLTVNGNKTSNITTL